MVLSPAQSPDSLPPLPKITSKAILDQVFTHRSYYARPSSVFEDQPDDPAPDNEALEHLGDSVLGLTVTSLIRDMHKNLRVGPATKIRAMVVGNVNLAALSVNYGLHRRLRVHHAQAISLQASSNIQADIFEAFVGGLYVDQGLTAVQKWLNTLLRPYIAEAYKIVRQDHGLLPLPDTVLPDPTLAPPSTQSTGHLALFNQHLQQRHMFVEWKYDLPEDSRSRSTPTWIVHAILDDVPLATGRGSTKKAAQNDAAKAGLLKIGVIVGNARIKVSSKSSPDVCRMTVGVGRSRHLCAEPVHGIAQRRAWGYMSSA